MPATAIEQLILELVNRARLDPGAEAARDGIDLNEGLAAGTISDTTRQPLAMNEALLTSARGHSQDMLNQGYFGHFSPQGSSPGDRETAAGYAWLGWGENIAWSGTTGTVTSDTSIALQKLLFVDSGIAGRGHRLDILNSAYAEVGVGQESGRFQGYNATLLTQDFGSPAGGGQFLTGVSYADADGNSFYSLGEGRNGTSVAVTGGGATATAGAGGYSLAIGAGLQTVTFSGGGLSGPIRVAVTVTAGQNAKVDVVDQSTITTSASLTNLGGARKIVGLGLNGLTLVGDASGDTFVGTKGNDTIRGGAGVDTVVYTSARAAYTVTATPGQPVLVSGPEGNDSLTGIEHLAFADTTVELQTAPSTSPIIVGNGDYNADHVADILFRNTSTGDFGYLASNLGGAPNYHPLGGSNAAYAIAGIGDINADGTSDILYRRAYDGDFGYSALDAATGGSAYHPLGFSNPTYAVAGIGDFNADGASDILYRNNSTGDFGYFALDAATGTSIYRALDGSNATYSVVGIGDFNADKTSDILFRNNMTGDFGYSALNASTGGSTYHPLGGSNALYQVVGVGDFNGDGTSDILFRNAQSGEFGFAALTIAGGSAYVPLGLSNTAYNVVGTGDYNGDGLADVLFRNSLTGDLGYESISAAGQGIYHPLSGSNAEYTAY